MATLRGIVLVVFLVALPPTGAHAQDVQSEARASIEEARRLYVELDFVASIEVLARTLATPGLPDALRASALEIQAAACVVLDREACARDALTSLFALDPYYVVREPSGSPRIQRFVEEVRGSVVPDAAFDPNAELRPELPRSGRSGSPLRVVVEARGGDAERVVVASRSDTETEWQVHDAHRDGERWVAEVRVPADAVQLELYAEARDAEGRLRSRAAGPLSPLRIPIESSSGGGGETPILESWWLWTIVGAVVIGALAIGLGVGLSGPSRAEPGTLSPGRVELPLMF